jgi:hypothetical protein
LTLISDFFLFVRAGEAWRFPTFSAANRQARSLAEPSAARRFKSLAHADLECVRAALPTIHEQAQPRSSLLALR